MNGKLLVISLLTLSCNDSNDANKFLFNVPVNFDVSIKVTDHDEPPPPPVVKPYYANFNFIIDSTGNLYFFQQQTYRWICGTGLDENTLPEYIDLRPTEIVAVPLNGLKSFIDSNIFNHDPDARIVAIGFLKDTIKSEGLYNLTQLLKDTSNKTRWFIRHSTQEEAIVLNFKKRQARFYPDDIHWDSSKTRFPPKVDITKFTPPKIEE